MKRFVLLSIIMIVLGLCCQSCRNFMYSHNVHQVADGKVFRLGTPEFNLLFVRGTVTTTIARENTEAVMETNNGDAVGKPTGTFRGLTTVRFRTGPQMTGYLKDVAKRDPVTARKYVEQMPGLNKAQWDVKQETPVDVNIEDASKKAEEIVNPFECDGNCDLQDLWKNNTIAYQNAVAVKLLNYTDDKATFPDSKTTFYHSLQSFITRLAKLTVRGRTVTQMRIKEVTIRDNQIKDMLFIMIEPDGNTFDTTCPECVLEDE